MILGSTRRYATELYQPLSDRQNMFGRFTARSSARRSSFRRRQPRRRVRRADRDRRRSTSARRSARRARFAPGFKWLHLRGDPTIAGIRRRVPDRSRQTKRARRLLLRWDTLDHPYFPRSGMRANAEVFSARARRRYSAYSTSRQQLARRRSRRRGMVVRPRTRSSTSRRAPAASPSTRRQRDRGLQSRRLPAALGAAHQPTARQLPGLRARRLLPPDRAPCPSSGAPFTSADRSRPATCGQTAARSRPAIWTAGSVFLAADTWLGPFYVAWGLASGGQRSFYLYLGRLREALPARAPARNAHAVACRAQPRGGLASVHADESARDAADRADRARRRRVARRLRRPPLSRRGELVVGQPLRPRESAHQRGGPRAARHAAARACSRASRTARWSSCRSGWRTRADRDSAMRSTAPTARRRPRSRSR